MQKFEIRIGCSYEVNEIKISFLKKNREFLPSNWCRGSSSSSERETGKNLSIKNTELGIARDRYSGQGQGQDR